MELTETVTFTMFNRIVVGYGSIALAALGIGVRIWDIVFMPILGVGHGLLPIVGYCFGAHIWSRLWAAVKLASFTLAVMLGLTTVILEIFAPQVIAFFNADPKLLVVAIPGMRIIMSTLILIGPSIMFITTFQGLSKGNTALVLSLARQLVFFIPALLVLPRYLGITGVWLSLPIADGCGGIISALWLYREYRLQKRAGIWE